MILLECHNTFCLTPGEAEVSKQSESRAGARRSRKEAFLCLLIALLSVFLPLPLTASPLDSLSHSPEWEALLHIQRPSLFSTHSRVDDPDFFFSKEGRFSPRKELEATVKAFQSSDPEDLNDHPICRYPARFRWIRKVLPELALAPRDCPEFREWSGAINAQAITLLFPRSLAYTANYSAQTGGEGAVAYALRGVFGGFEGQFSVAPYYKKLVKYSDIEHRDIWEYQLNLSSDEVQRVVEHLWELRNISYYYYYFDENCSYQLLAILDVARPELALTRRYPISVIPADTVRDVVLEEGLLRQKVFRPSQATVLRHRLAVSGERERQYGLQLANGEITPSALESKVLATEERAAALELGYDFVVFREARKKRAEQSNDLKFSLLAARSALGGRSVGGKVRTPAYSPEEGHRSGRVGVGGGVAFDAAYASFRWRPAYHDLLDPQPGYDLGSSIRFLESEVRQYRGSSPRIEKAEILGIDSLTPDQFFFRSISWGGSVGFFRREFSFQDEHLLFRVQVQAGKSYESKPGHIYLLGLMTEEVSTHYTKGAVTGAGGRIGSYLRFGDGESLAIHPYFEGKRFFVGDTFTDLAAGAEGSYEIARNVSVKVRAERKWGLVDPDNQIGIGVDWFFQ
jgi:hypothetical protein